MIQRVLGFMGQVSRFSVLVLSTVKNRLPDFTQRQSSFFKPINTNNSLYLDKLIY